MPDPELNISGGKIKLLKGIQIMRTNITVIMVVVLLFATYQVQAGNKVFTESGEINDPEIWDTVEVHNDATIVDMWGGSAGDIWAFDSSTVNIYGGEIFGFNQLFYEQGIAAFESSTVNITGGNICCAGPWSSSSILNISGGNTSLLAAGGGTINIYGYDFILSDTGGAYDLGFVSGRWTDDMQFYTDLYYSYPLINLHIIPEPSTFALLLLGAFGLRKKMLYTNA